MTRKLLLTYLLLIVFPLTIVTAVAYTAFKHNMEKRVSQSVERSVQLLQHEAENYFGGLVSLSAQIMQQDGTSEGFGIPELLAERIDHADGRDPYEDYTQNQKIHLYLNTNILDRQRDIKMAAVHLIDGETFQSKRTAANIDEATLDRMLAEAGQSDRQWFVRAISPSDPAPEFYLIRKINLPGPNRFLGILIFEVKMESFTVTLRNALLQGQEAVLLWRQTTALYDSGQWWRDLPVELPPQQSRSLLRDSGKGRILVTYSSPMDSDWAVVAYIPFGKLSEEIVPILRTLTVSAIVCIAVAILMAALLARSILRPVWSLRNAMRRMAKGFLQTQVAVQGKDEMAELTQVFNLMSRELSDMIDKVYKAELSQKNAELQALQARIDPHFLYNTLESIRMVAEMQGSPDAGKMLRAMAVLFRAATDTESMVSLETEADLFEQYAMLQEIRLNGPLELSVQVEDEVSGCLVPKLTMQPLLENCFKHGYAKWPANKPVVIRLRAFEEDGDLCLDLTDFGNGMTEKRFEEIDRTLRSEGYAPATGSGIGLLNVHERIRKRWGSGYGISLFSKPEMGTVVSVRLPIRRKETEAWEHANPDR